MDCDVFSLFLKRLCEEKGNFDILYLLPYLEIFPDLEGILSPLSLEPYLNTGELDESF